MNEVHSALLGIGNGRYWQWKVLAMEGFSLHETVM